MESSLLFLNIIAWVLAILSTLYLALILYKANTYPGSLEGLGDKLNGFTQVFRPWKPFVVSLICWAFIFAF